MKSRDWIPTAAILLLSCAFSASAGTPIVQHLESIRNVELGLPNGLRFEPVQGLDLVELERLLKESANRILQERGIEVADQSDIRLQISLTKELADCNSRKIYAFAGRVRLVERAALERNMEGKDGSETVEATSWESQLLFLSTPEEALGDIVAEVAYAIELFANDVVAARAYGERKAAVGRF